jgi:hypothetical protein
MPQYESVGFDPPAPLVRAVVRGPGDDEARDVPFLLGAGADTSLVPRAVAERVGARISASGIRLESYRGDTWMADRAEVTIEFLVYRFQAEVLVSDVWYGILGRNILNLIVLTLDGPRLTWSA